MYLALIEPGSYLDFANPVPFSGASGVVEQGVLNEQGRISGRAQSAVRSLSPGDFNRIVTMGVNESEPCSRALTMNCHCRVFRRRAKAVRI